MKRAVRELLYEALWQQAAYPGCYYSNAIRLPAAARRYATIDARSLPKRWLDVPTTIGPRRPYRGTCRTGAQAAVERTATLEARGRLSRCCAARAKTVDAAGTARCPVQHHKPPEVDQTGAATPLNEDDQACSSRGFGTASFRIDERETASGRRSCAPYLRRRHHEGWLEENCYLNMALSQGPQHRGLR